MNALSMKSAGRMVLACAVVAVLAGCASGGSSMAVNSGYSGNDADYMYAVERTARQRGVRIVWVNPPPEQGKDYVTVR